ncbi:hypothetical protein FGG08_004721 [Glutinoglossum americanum]|uniref:Transmembrane protein n=1 Tax=Glutinoglossum americanum TaxID=1670608 RepID=A0A9P8I8M5_9PEZI|nr:hypothetical protein FGG08_004721 [Glutinoglossum americanum]
MTSIEQMMRSQTVFSTIQSALSLRLFSFSTLILLSLWSLNPIGGQASLRALSLDTPISTHSTPISYMSLDPQIALKFDVFGGLSSITYYRPLISSLFGSALYSPEAAVQYLVGSEQEANLTNVITRLGGMDTAILRSEQDSWGNVRIPVLHLLPGFDPDAPDTWVHVPADEVPSLSSIIGVPIQYLPTRFGGISSGNITFNMESNYHRFECFDWKLLSGDGEVAWLDANNYNLSALPFSVHESTGFFLDTNTSDTSRVKPWANNDTTTQMPARTIWFASRGDDLGRDLEMITSVTYCAISQEYVEARVQCSNAGPDSRTGCAITAMRQSQKPHFCSNFTELDAGIYESHLSVLSNILPESHSFTSSPQEFFLYDPPGAFTNIKYSVSAVQMSHVPINVFQDRLAFLYNTFSTITKAPNLIVGGEFVSPFGDGSILVSANAEWSYLLGPVYRLHTDWAAVYFFAVAVLCICAFWTVIVRLRLRVPDMLGSVSSLTRDSAFIGVPSAASTLDGDERARLLKDMWIRLQDVQPGAQIGRISLSSNQSLRDNGLDRQRFYE